MSTNNRASLLANLRTGGVRSTTNPLPQTAAPTMTSFPTQDFPMSPNVNGSFNMYPATAQAQAQAFQMQMMQMEIMRLQALQQVQQAQQYQMELARQQQTSNRRVSQLMEPATAGPTATSFNRRSSQAEQLKAQLHLSSRPAVEDQVPMTASLGGKFGGRLNPHATTFRFGGLAEEDEATRAMKSGNTAPNNTPVTPSYTTVISGGTALGMSNGGTGNVHTTVMAPSKSDTAVNWRRGGNNSVLNGNRAASVNVKITPPPGERVSPPPGLKSRPEPLRFSIIIDEALPTVALDGSDGENTEDADDSSSSSSAKSDSVPATPPTAGSADSGIPPLSPREEASKRLYEGLGLGRPAPQSAQVHAVGFPPSTNTGLNAPYTSVGMAFPGRAMSQPMRQPRGPPSGVDELGPKNFATRIRRKAIGGLGAMLDARVNRREIEAF